MELILECGDIVVCALSGDYGKPRPAVIIQSDLFNETHASITLCPITAHIVDASLFRLFLSPSKKNGLSKISQIMVDKITTLKREKISKKIGKLNEHQQQSLSQALKIWLNLL